MGVIDPAVESVWLVDSSPAVVTTSIMPIMDIAISVPDPSFVKANVLVP
jgi:hypothetical protein